MYYGSSTDTEFAGFATTTETDQNGNTTTTYIHQGNGSQSALGEYNDSFEKIGKPYLTEIRDDGGNLYQRTIDRWDSQPIATSSSFVFKSREAIQQYDGNSDHKDTAVEHAYNSNGATKPLRPNGAKSWQVPLMEALPIQARISALRPMRIQAALVRTGPASRPRRPSQINRLGRFVNPNTTMTACPKVQ